MAKKINEIHEMKAFTQETFKATEKVWKAKTANATFPTEAAQLLGWIQAQMAEREPHACCAYGLFEKGSDVADAVCEVVVKRITSRSKWVKMLRLRLNPELDERIYSDDIHAFDEVIGLYGSGVLGVLKLKNEVNATTLKIFGRSAEQLNFLRVLGSFLEKQKLLKDHSIQMKGRWLVIENS